MAELNILLSAEVGVEALLGISEEWGYNKKYNELCLNQYLVKFINVFQSKGEYGILMKRYFGIQDILNPNECLWFGSMLIIAIKKGVQ